MDISKSSYVSFISCPKSLALSLSNPELAATDPTAKKRIEDGHKVGEAALGLFPGIINVASKEGLDKQAQIEKTLEALKQDHVAIAEASFRVGRLYCACDILVKDGERFKIYEVKAATHIDETYYFDTAFQRFVLDQAGYQVDEVNLILLNPSYVRHGDLDLSKLFQIIRLDKTPEFSEAYAGIPDTLNVFDDTLEDAENTSYIGNQCKGCPFFAYCHKDLPSPNVLDINGIVKGHDYLNIGVITFEDAYRAKSWKKRQQVQIESYLNQQELVIDKKAVRHFLEKLTYPIYHLDFETMQMAIPLFDEAKPYEQIPFQYSLHIEQSPCGETIHKGYLGRKLDCRREIAESLCRDIPLDVTSMAYNMAFEKAVLSRLALLYPDLADHLLNIRDHMVDLLVPFKAGDYYRAAMGGSNSIKAVLPACCPNDPDLDYHALPVVHNGAEAMEIYPHLVEASGEEQEKIYAGLWVYCGLDTLAMVKVLDRLYLDSQD